MTDNLYRSLSHNLRTDDDLTQEEIKYIRTTTETMDTEKVEAIYMLILYHFQQNNEDSKVIYPYKSKQIGKDIKINLELLPLILKHVLFKFCKITNNDIGD